MILNLILDLNNFVTKTIIPQKIADESGQVVPQGGKQLTHIVRVGG